MTVKPHVLLATCARLPEGDEDAAALDQALLRHGVAASWSVWDDPSPRWHEGLVVLRSTWDYTARRVEFLDWVGGLPAVANPSQVVRWNADKTYLRDLEQAGLPIVPTVFAGPEQDLEDLDWPDADEVVVKPAVGAGSRGAGRFARADLAAARDHAAQLQQAGLTVLVQPYLTDVDTRGETALIHVDGAFSHAIRKSAMLPAGTAHPVSGAELYLPETIGARTPDAAELALGAAAIAFVVDRFGGAPLYARVDLLPGPGGPVVIELELVEPSLFLSHAPAIAVDTFAAAIAARA